MKSTKTPSKRKSVPRSVVTRTSGRPWNIVGIGCSAGGLEACQQFFDQLPVDTGLGFVVISHLDPGRKGILPELLQRHTLMKVSQIRDGMKVMPNCVYVIPPNVDLSILHGKLHLLELVAPHGMRLPIDFFFKQLAQDQKEKSICIILSGMGTDGTLGLKAIKEQFGLALVQDPVTAKYDGMPRSAIGTGLVDIVAPATELPAKLTGFVKHAITLPRFTSAVIEKPVSGLEKIFVLLRARTGADFSGYKPATIYRRVERRMIVHQLQPMANYIRYLRENPAEVDLLFREMLIGVTSFFRDPLAFEIIKTKALPALLAHKEAGTPLRVWVPGCSTGEEAYSVLIMLNESLRFHRTEVTVQMFATDLDKEAIDKARQGTFPENIAAEVSPARLQRYFVHNEHNYRFKKELREHVVFAPQNLLSDPPFTKIDLICCRNLLIYLNTDWQKKVLALFHYALNPGGILFLGSAETTSGLTDLFTPLDNRWKIFQRKVTSAKRPAIVELPSAPSALLSSSEKKPAVRFPDVAEIVQRSLLDTYVPPAVVVNKDGDIIYVIGRTGKYLEPASGKVNLNVFAMAREGLRIELGLAIRNAFKRRASVRLENLRVKTNGSHQLINLTVRPLTTVADAGSLLLVVFEDVETNAPERKPRLTLRAKGLSNALERELQQTKAQLQSTLEDGLATQEELRAANEELQSNNEELQSTNEELTTSKEELQSLNEEMTTVNSELQGKLDELAQVNNDMKNLLDGIDIATIFTDNEVRVKRFTAQATRIINLIPGDVGRPLRDLVTKLKYDHMVEDAKNVLITLVFKEEQVQSMDNRWYLMRILPYRVKENLIDGVVFTFSDITQVKQLEMSLKESQVGRIEAEEASLLAENILATVRAPLLILDADLRVVSANRTFYDKFRITPKQTEQQLFYEVGDRQWDIPELRRMLSEILPHHAEMLDFKVTHHFPSLGDKVMLLNARQIMRPGQRQPLILLSIEDITDQKANS